MSKRKLSFIIILIFIFIGFIANLYVGRLLAREVDYLITKEFASNDRIEEFNYDKIEVNPMLRKISLVGIDYSDSNKIVTADSLVTSISYQQLYDLVQQREVEFKELKQLKLKFSDLNLEDISSNLNIFISDVVMNFSGNFNLSSSDMKRNFWSKDQKIEVTATDLHWDLLEKNNLEIIFESNLKELDILSLDIIYRAQEELININDLFLQGPTVELKHNEKISLNQSYPEVQIKERKMKGYYSFSTGTIDIISSGNSNYEIEDFNLKAEYDIKLPQQLLVARSGSDNLEIAGVAESELLIKGIKIADNSAQLNNSLVGYQNQFKIDQMLLNNKLTDMNSNSQLLLDSSFFELDGSLDLDLNLLNFKQSFVNQLDLEISEIDSNLEMLLMMLIYETGLNFTRDEAGLNYSYQGKLEGILGELDY